MSYANSGAKQPAKGTYLILIYLQQEMQIVVGRKGDFLFPSGWYAYLGSALGPGGLQARLARHRRHDKPLHWHIDYLLEHGTLEASWAVECLCRLECVWALAVRDMPDAQVIVPGFGASDCRCPGHLIYFPCRPPNAEIEKVLRAYSHGKSSSATLSTGR